MTPEPPEHETRLNRRGRVTAAGGVALLFVGATSGAPWVAVAGAALLAMCARALVRGRRLARALAATETAFADVAAPLAPCGVPRTLRVRLTTSDAPLRALNIETVVSGPGEAFIPSQTLDVPARATGVLTLTLTPDRAGLWHVWGFVLSAGDRLGLVTHRTWRAQSAFLHAGPRPVSRAIGATVLQRIGAVRDREGRHLDRQNGTGLELRELRDYVPGDPLKAVAWKASARRGRWLVRAYEDESMRRFQVVLDIGPAMRRGPVGDAALDRGIDLAAELFRLAVAERVGLTTYDGRVVAHLRPDTGRAHGHRLLQQLLDVTRVVDEDLTEITDAELFARVGALLDAAGGPSLRRLPPPPARLAQPEALVDPVREIYDESAIFSAVSQAIVRERDRGHAMLFGKARPARDLASARLRLFCALFAIPIAYRRSDAPEQRDRGLAAAITRNLLTGGAETLVLLSTLDGLSPGGDAVRALGLCRARKRRVVAVALGAGLEPATRRALQAAGVTVIEPDGIVEKIQATSA
jgi:uncharacterized protein (DUF58 family)